MTGLPVEEESIIGVGQNGMFTPYMTVYLVISLPKNTVNTPYI